MPLINPRNERERQREGAIQRRIELKNERWLAPKMYKELRRTYRQASRLYARTPTENFPLQDIIDNHEKRTTKLLYRSNKQTGGANAVRVIAETNKKNLRTDLLEEVDRWAWLKGSVSAQEISSTTARRIQRIVNQGLAEDATSRQIADEIFKASSGAYNRSRSLTIARTEVHSSSQESMLNSVTKTAEEVDAVVTKKWVATQDGRTRETHKILGAKGKYIGKDDRFQVGESLMAYPGEKLQNNAKETINCRCFLVYKVK